MKISVVICSRDARAAVWVMRNLRRTAARPDLLEILAMENRAAPRGICAVYNEAMAKASGEVLVFMHEDVYMMEYGWDDVARKKFQVNPRLGMLGVAGSSFLLREPPLWSKAGPPWTFGKVVHELDGGREFFLTVLNEEDGDREVAALDGLWFAVRREVFDHCRFDEDNFPGFHFYDADFSLQAGTRWEVWATTDIRVKHLSAGHFGAEWQEAAQRFQAKWQPVLPLRRGLESAVQPGSGRFAGIDLRGKATQLTLL